MTDGPDGPDGSGAGPLHLVLARHGQTPANVARVLDTRLPGPGLTDLGRRQAAALGAELARGPAADGVAPGVVGVYSSAARRARETAGVVADAVGLVPEVVEGLQEVQVGDLEGRNDDDAVAEFRAVFERWSAGERDVAFPGGEGPADVVARYRDGVARIRARHPGGGTVVVVVHGAALRLAAADLVGGVGIPAPEDGHVDNCGRVVLRATPDGWTAVAWLGDAPGGLRSARDVTGG